MPIDAYSLCPGGTGKKIKFCCPDLLPDLQKVMRMIEGEQMLAALSHVETLLEKNPDRACLLALRAELLRNVGRFEDIAPNAARFLEAHPENQLAWAESSIAASLGGNCRRAVECVYRAMQSVEQQIYPATYDAMGLAAQCAASHSRWGAAFALLRLRVATNPKDNGPRRDVARLQAQQDIPLLLRCTLPKQAVQEDAPWLKALEEALRDVSKGHHLAAAEKLKNLTADAPNEPLPLQWLAEVQTSLADRQGEIESLRRLAALDIPWDDAVEAEARAMLISDDALGDGVDTLRIVWNVEDSEELQTAIRLDPRTFVLPNPPSESDDDDPPPRLTFVLLDRPTPGKDDEITPANLASPRAQGLLFGKRTDRDARLEVSGFLADHRSEIESQVAELVGGALGKIAEQEVIGRTSRSIDLIETEFTRPDVADPNALREAIGQFTREAVLDRWPEIALGALGGRTPRDVADSNPDKAQLRKLAAVVMTLQSLVESAAERELFEELKTRLKLPQPEPIDPEQTDIRRVPANRLDRLIVEKLSDDDLAIAFVRATSFMADAAVRRFAQALVDREHLGAAPPRLHAIEQLAYRQTDPAKAMEYIAIGRRACEQANQSAVDFDFVEMDVEATIGDARNISKLIDHIHRNHLEEPGVKERFMSYMVRFGIINPDGTPGPAVAAAQQHAAAAGAAMPGGQEAESGKLWTPQSEAGSGGGKLWTPD